MTKVPKITSLQFICDISRKTWRTKSIFCLQINIKYFLKLIPSFWACVTRHAQFTQNIVFAIFLQYHREKRVINLNFCVQVSMKVSFKLILWFLMGMVQHSQSSQNSKLAMSLQYVVMRISILNVVFSLVSM